MRKKQAVFGVLLFSIVRVWGQFPFSILGGQTNNNNNNSTNNNNNGNWLESIINSAMNFAAEHPEYVNNGWNRWNNGPYPYNGYGPYPYNGYGPYPYNGYGPYPYNGNYRRNNIGIQ